MKKWIPLLLAAMLLLAGCGQRLAESYSPDTLNQRVQEVVAVLGSGDYDAMVGLLREDYATGLTGEALRESWSVKLDTLGEFEEIVNSASMGMTQDGVDYAVVAAVCSYAQGKATFALTFDPEYNLVGMYLR